MRGDPGLFHSPGDPRTFGWMSDRLPDEPRFSERVRAGGGGSVTIEAQPANQDGDLRREQRAGGSQLTIYTTKKSLLLSEA